MALMTTACGRRGASQTPSQHRTVVRSHGSPNAAPTALASDAGAERIAMIAQVPPPGPSPDGREIDVPLSWVYLVEDPAPTGSTPYAVVGAQVPCGYRPAFTASERDAENHTVRIRMRARWARTEPPPVDGRPTCGDVSVATELVSLGQLRFGQWQVVDAAQTTPTGDGGVDTARSTLAPRVQHVVADDNSLAPRAQRWMHPCAQDSDCESSVGGVCARIGHSTACVAPVDPWLSLGRACAAGLTAVEIETVAAPSRRWRACIATCTNHTCPGTLRCDPLGVCVPPPSPRVVASCNCG